MADEENVRLFVCDIPKGYGLFPLIQTIGELLGSSAVLKIEFARNQSGSRIDGIAEILLKNNDCEKSVILGIIYGKSFCSVCCVVL